MDLESNSTMLIRAASEGNYEELCEILNGLDFDKNIINQALYQAVLKSQSASDHLRCVETLLSTGNPNYKDQNGVSLLMIAAKLGQIQLAELLINCGSSVEDKDKDSRTPLMYAVESCYGDNVDVVKFLLDKKAKVGLQDNSGNSALHRSAERGYADSMQVLLDFGAFINAENKDKDTPLHLACKAKFEHCVELLISKKANMHLQNAQGKTPIDLAPEHLKVMLETPQDCASDSSFCSVSSHNETLCKICKRGMAEWICKSCHENNLLYNIQTFQENRKLIEDYAKEIGELKMVNIETHKELKAKSERCKRYKKLIQEKDNEFKRKEDKIVMFNIVEKEQLQAKLDEGLLRIKEYEEEVESLKEQIINLKSDVKFHRTDSDLLRKRLEESKHKDAGSLYSIKHTLKKSALSFLNPIQSKDKSKFLSNLTEDITLFTEEIQKWQDEAELVYSDLTNRIKKLIKKKFHNCTIEIYGSYATKLHLPSSDIDMVIMNVEGNKRDFLRSVDKVLKTQNYVKNTNLILQAMIPLIKVRSELSGRVVQIDITLYDNNHSGIKGLGVVSRLLQQSPIIRPVFLILKELLYVCGFKEPYLGGLGSYSLFLMVASFIQQRFEVNEKINSEMSVISEWFISVLEHYIDENNYYVPIVTNDPANGKTKLTFENPEGYNPYTKFTVVDPMNKMNNVAFKTNANRLITIFKTAHYHLKRNPLCDCTFSNSPIYRMIFETREDMNNN